MTMRKTTTFRKTICLVISSLLLCFNSAPVVPRPLQRFVIAKGQPGEAAVAFNGHFSFQETIGYITNIVGYDGPVFSSETRQDETTAHFTYDGTMLAPPKMFQQGRLLIIHLSLRERGYFQANPHGDYSKPETFRDGIQIYEYRGLIQVILDRSTGTSIYSSIHGYTQTLAESFTLAGTTYTYGEVGNRTKLVIYATPAPNNPMQEADIVGELIQFGPGT